jgi:hypothetical protein
MADTNETITDIIAEMRFHGQQNIDAEKDKPEYGILTVEGRIAQNYADRLEAAHRREADSIHRAMVILAGIEMPDAENPPGLWTALEDAYNALSDALGTDGDTTADEEEAKSTGRHFVIRPSGDRAKLREALEHMVRAETYGSMERDDLCGRCLEKMFARCKHDGTCWVDKAITALAAPPRNCDAMDWRTAWKMWREKFHHETPVGYSAVVKGTEAFMDWFTAPATEQEGGAK